MRIPPVWAPGPNFSLPGGSNLNICPTGDLEREYEIIAASSPANCPFPSLLDLRMRSPLIARAADFASERHSGVYRKFSKRPYFVHCEAVARIVGAFYDDSEVIAAAFLHDAIEDEVTTARELRNLFGARVTLFVSEVSKPVFPEGTSDRIKQEVFNQGLREASSQSASIKVADILHNTSSPERMLSHDPIFARRYIPQKEQQLSGLRHANTRLYSLGVAVVSHAKSTIGI